MPRMKIKLLILSALTAISACKRPATGSGTITLAGSTSVQPFAEKWAEAYMDKHKDVKISVQGGGSTAGVKAALDGAAQIGTCSRELKADEAQQLKATVVARDGIAVVVNPKNSVGDLTLDQVKGIYSGTITDWGDVGGTPGKIDVITREEGSGTRDAFTELALAKGKIFDKAQVLDSTGAVRQSVSSDASSIGYISLGQVDQSVKAVKLGGVDASEASIDAGKYPLVRPFLFATKGDPAGQTKDFIAWITGPEGQALTRKEGLLPPKQ
jgi:phosphate transport system substrate-binding protein